MWTGNAIKEHFCCLLLSWQWSCSNLLSQYKSRAVWVLCVSVLRDTRWLQLWHKTCQLTLRRCRPSTGCTLRRQPGKHESQTSRGHQTLFKGEKKGEIFWLSPISTPSSGEIWHCRLVMNTTWGVSPAPLGGLKVVIQPCWCIVKFRPTFVRQMAPTLPAREQQQIILKIS